MQTNIYRYLSVPPLLEIWGNYVTTLGRLTISAAESLQKYPTPGPSLYHYEWSKGRVLPEFCLVLISEGVGEFESEPSGRCSVGPGSVMILFPGVKHRYRPTPGTGWVERWIAMNGDHLHRLSDSGILSPQQAIGIVDPVERYCAQFDALLQTMDEVYGKKPLLFTAEALAYFVSAAQDANLLLDPEKPSHKSMGFLLADPLVDRACQMIWSQSHLPLTVQWLARVLETSKRTLFRRFQQATGKTILEEINLCRLERAKRLLRETMLPIKRITFLAGFGCYEAFRKVMQKHEGYSPAEYRKRFISKKRGMTHTVNE
ncbi:MAG: AraC family transcriptional regulator [Planctomycetaceae bacterium]|nr:AraC family transcriptional regulator [Planctomycetaceae bacterium]